MMSPGALRPVATIPERFLPLQDPTGDWVVECMIQGAWLREYHEWEKATKNYFEKQHQRNASPKPDWKSKLPSVCGSASHVDRVRAQLSLFATHMPDTILEII